MVSQRFLDAFRAQAGQAGDRLDKPALQSIKQRVARSLGEPMPTDAQLWTVLEDAPFRDALRTKPMRSQSGVAVVAVMSSPAACPHGKCVYCPGGPEVGVPQSYTGHEPSTMRAIRWSYDPYRIVRARLAQLAANGHPVDKVDVVVQGGTFPAREEAYQDWFLTGVYEGLNDGPATAPAPWDAESSWMGLTPDERHRRRRAAMRRNEGALSRAIGLTIETKPDWCLEPHVDRMLDQGCTRVELGLQTLDEATLRFTNRGHSLDDSRRAMQVARDAGLKVCVHMMPGLPRERQDGRTGGREVHAMPGLPRQREGAPGSGKVTGGAGNEDGGARADLDPDPAMDADDLRRLFAEPDWRPDMLKVYPTLVVQEGETPLKRWWREGRYTPYGTAQASSVIRRGLVHVPSWCRIQRVDRDIPTTHVEAGVENSNLRQIVEDGAPWLRDLRRREAGSRSRQGVDVDPQRVVPVRTEYDASGGRECFLSLEDPAADAVHGFLRLRRTGPAHREECRGAAIVRELKVFGPQVGLGQRGEGLQHRGLGTRLLAWAERIAFEEWRAERVLVTAGVGVKRYYEARGYTAMGPYMAKDGPGPT